MQNSHTPIVTTMTGDPTVTRWERRDLAAALGLPERSPSTDEIVTIVEPLLAARLVTAVDSAARTNPRLTSIETLRLASSNYIPLNPDAFTPIIEAVEALLRARITPIYPEHPDDIAADGGTRVIRNYAACQSHCCARHGCKYDYRGCPVTTGLVAQDHPCERCTDDLYEQAFFADAPGPQPGEVGYQITLGLKRAATDGHPMADMPTDAQVASAVTDALAGLTVNGWTLTRVLGADTEDGDDDDH